MKTHETIPDARAESLTDIITHRMSTVAVSLVEARLEVLRDPAQPFSETDKYRLVAAASELIGIANRVLALADVEPEHPSTTPNASW